MASVARGFLTRLVTSLTHQDDLLTSASKPTSFFYNSNQRLQAAQSGGHHGGGSGGLGGLFGSSGSFGLGGMMDCFTIDICPDLLLAAIAAAASAAFILIYQSVTMAVRRRRRSFERNDDPLAAFYDVAHLALEEFEHLLEDVGQTYFSTQEDGQDNASFEEVLDDDGLESPMLDTSI